MSQKTASVSCWKKGSILAVEASGIRTMSDSLIAFQPSIDEPSNIVPSSKRSSSTISEWNVTCCSLPFGSVKRRSRNLMSSSFIFLSSCSVDLLAMMVPFPVVSVSIYNYSDEWPRMRPIQINFALAAYSAASPVSPVRIRMAWLTSETKIFPSPILPVLAAV